MKQEIARKEPGEAFIGEVTQPWAKEARHRRPRHGTSSSCKASRTGASRDRRGPAAGPGALEGNEGRLVSFRVSLQGGENVLKLAAVMVTQLCRY